jgi:hypothetical protein
MQQYSSQQISTNREQKLSPLLKALLFATTISLGACTLFLNHDANQCSADVDCASFGQSVCDLATHVCISNPDASATANDADTCIGTSGCYLCTPSNEQQILSACSDSTCVPFDNTRLTNLNLDGTLKPLP